MSIFADLANFSTHGSSTWNLVLVPIFLIVAWSARIGSEMLKCSASLILCVSLEKQSDIEFFFAGDVMELEVVAHHLLDHVPNPLVLYVP